ncbi:MAG: hypothetical protein IPN84_11290 [Sphingomonadales bacterium]|nr:hypothetical protein [Sphingomonadales bacterium]
MGIVLGVDNIETEALGTHMSFPMKDDIIRSILELNAPSASFVDEVDDILDDIRDAMQLRNIVAHNEFAIHPETAEIFSLRIKARGSLQSELKKVTAEELLETADQIYRAGMSLQDFMLKNHLGPRFRRTSPRASESRTKSKASPARLSTVPIIEMEA